VPATKSSPASKQHGPDGRHALRRVQAESPGTVHVGWRHQPEITAPQRPLWYSAHPAVTGRLAHNCDLTQLPVASCMTELAHRAPPNDTAQPCSHTGTDTAALCYEWHLSTHLLTRCLMSDPEGPPSVPGLLVWLVSAVGWALSAPAACTTGVPHPTATVMTARWPLRLQPLTVQKQAQRAVTRSAVWPKGNQQHKRFFKGFWSPTCRCPGSRALSCCRVPQRGRGPWG